MANLLRDWKPQLKDQILEILDGLLENLKGSIDEDTKVDAVSCVWYSSNLESPIVETLVELGVLELISTLLEAKKESILFTCLKLMNNIAAKQTSWEQFLSHGCVERVLKLLHHPSNVIIKETCGVVATLLAFSNETVQEFCFQGVLQTLIDLWISANPLIKDDAILGIHKIVTHDEKEIFENFWENKGIEAIYYSV